MPYQFSSARAVARAGAVLLLLAQVVSPPIAAQVRGGRGDSPPAGRAAPVTGAFDFSRTMRVDYFHGGGPTTGSPPASKWPGNSPAIASSRFDED